MWILWLGLVVVCTSACTHFGNTDHTAVSTYSEVAKTTDSALVRKNGTWYYRDTLFSGTILEYEGSACIANLPVKTGKEHGVAIGYYPNGRLRFQRSYQNGSRHGQHTGWYPNGKVSFLYNFQNDMYEGEQLSYHSNGQLRQQRRYAAGHEEGKQKEWDENGKVVNNYTVKNGKLYGVVGRYDCMSLHKKNQ